MSLRDRIRRVSLIFACGTALLSDGYANGVIGSVNTILTRIYGSDFLKKHNYSVIISSLGFAGTVVGMLLFGYLSDKIGRKFGMMAASGAHGSVGGLLSMLGAMRFLLGIGIGAENPSGSVSASEQSEGQAINNMIDFGFVIAAFVPLVLFWIFGNDHLRTVWRLSLGLGIVPALCFFLWRLNMEEPERYRKDSMKQARIPYMLVIRRYGVSLAAISFIWFLYDFIVYPFGLFSSIIINNFTGGSTDLTVVLGWNVVINLFYMPGTFGGAFILDYLGPKYTLIAGLVLQTVVGFIMSGLYMHLTNHIAAFAVVYGIFLSLGEVGPGNCTILLASKTSSTAVRGHFYGIAAAVGKVGAFVGTWAFPPMIDAFGGPDTARGNTGPFLVGSGLALLSAIITLFFIKPLSHDGMEEEDRKFREYLEAHGYDTSQMGFEDSGSDTTSVTDEKKEEV